MRVKRWWKLGSSLVVTLAYLLILFATGCNNKQSETTVGTPATTGPPSAPAAPTKPVPT